MPTHAGGIVVRDTPKGPEYLIVRARVDPSQWIFPKGRIEPGETAAAAAAREVREESGVDAAVVSTLPSIGPGGEIALYLMRYQADVPSTEGREPAWVGYEEARRRLTFPDSRAALDRARTAIEKR